MSILNLRSEEPVPEPVDPNALDETPPGLEAIRAWIRKPHPWLRGVWLWIRWILRGIRAAYRYVRKNWPAARERIHRIATEGEKVARVAVRVGTAARRVGGGIVRSTRALRGPDGKVSGATARVRELGRAVQGFGGRLTEGGTGIAGALSSVGHLTRALRGNDVTGLGLLDPPEERERKQPPPPTPRPNKPKSRRTPSPAPGQDVHHGPDSPVPPQAPTPRPTPSAPPTDNKATPAPPASVKPTPDRLEGLPEVFVHRVNALRERTPRNELWPLIFDICGWREWTTPAELARWLSMHQHSLTKRHLRPMTKEGLLELRYPDQRSSPRQAYRARRRSAPGVASGRPPNSDPDQPATPA